MNTTATKYSVPLSTGTIDELLLVCQRVADEILHSDGRTKALRHRELAAIVAFEESVRFNSEPLDE